MVNCSFCSKELKPGTGMMFVKKEGTALFFCSRKCRMNMLKLERSPASRKWASGKKIVKGGFVGKKHDNHKA